MAYTYEYPHPAVTVDCVLFGFDESGLKVLLIQRAVEPYKNLWAFPGGFVRMDESLYDAAVRELRQETGLDGVFLEQLYTFGTPDRDPRERTISVAYYALVSLAGRQPHAATDAASAAWFLLDHLPLLAFDHLPIFHHAFARLRLKIRYAPIGFELLPKKFTLSQLQYLYETILRRPLDKRNFRKKILSFDVLKETGEMQTSVSHRAARLYQFDEKKYQKLLAGGFHFEL
ncbi:MAG: NUDIX domain-containing protein [Tepidisphaeraceae bacterium]